MGLFNNKKIFVFGNEDLKMDSLPLRIMPVLKKDFPNINFEIKDPNEEWDIPEEMIVLDTALGIKNVVVFEDLNKFSSVPRVSMHDFDALSNIRYLFKLGKIKKIKIVAVPSSFEESKATEEVSEILKKISATLE